MNFTVGLPIRRVGADQSFADPSFVRDAILFAEEAGFWGFTAPDHIVAPRTWAEAGGGEEWIDPFALLGFAAGITTRIRLITHTIVLPYRTPFAVAKAVASLDHLSGGRMVFGCGSGYLREEFEILGVPFEERGERADEALRFVTACWAADGDVELDGSFHSIHGARVAPRPAQRPRPPIWIGGNSMRAVRRTVEFGDCWTPFDITDDQMREGLARAVELGRPVELAAPLGRVQQGDEVVARADALRTLGASYLKCGFGGRTPVAWFENARWFTKELLE